MILIDDAMDNARLIGIEFVIPFGAIPTEVVREKLIAPNVVPFPKEGVVPGVPNERIARRDDVFVGELNLLESQRERFPSRVCPPSWYFSRPMRRVGVEVVEVVVRPDSTEVDSERRKCQSLMGYLLIPSG